MPEVDQPFQVSSSNTSNGVPFGASILVIDDEAGIRESLEVLGVVVGVFRRL